MVKQDEKNIYYYIDALISYAIKKELIEEVDKVYFINQLISVLKLDDYQKSSYNEDLELVTILDNIIDYAIKNNIIDDTQNSKDLFDTKVMTVFSDKPSSIINTFKTKYKDNPKDATDWFYKYSKDVNYIRTDRILKDIKWETETKYGVLNITVNLSKPEKDPKDILKAKEMTQSKYPLCALCKENEGYSGRINHPARGNLRLIPITLDNEPYFLQYSPYSYYNEHAIILSNNHTPMVINKKTFRKLLDFLDIFPHYFIGSNADLGIVGGSILSHDHFQGGRFTFPMDKASNVYETKYKDTEVSILYWPLSVIRLKGKNKEELVELSDKILNKWIDYDNKDLEIISHTDGVRHNTITPISRYENNQYVIDLVLRCNIQTDERPFGVFHPREVYHHIKKENIGLIEVLGLAILPSRLKKELELIKNHILNKEKEYLPEIEKHHDWIEKMESKYDFNKENIDKILQDEVGNIFMLLLEDCGVFKQNRDEINNFIEFIESIVK